MAATVQAEMIILNEEEQRGRRNALVPDSHSHHGREDDDPSLHERTSMNTNDHNVGMNRRSSAGIEHRPSSSYDKIKYPRLSRHSINMPESYSSNREAIQSSKVDTRHRCETCRKVLTVEQILSYFNGPEGSNIVCDLLNETCLEDVFQEDDEQHEVMLSMDCPNCKEEIEEIRLLVDGNLEWDHHLEDERGPEALVFTSADVIGVLPKYSTGIDFG